MMLLFLSLYIISMFIIGDRKRRENGDFPYDYKIKKTKEYKIKYFANQPIYDIHIATSIKSNPEFKSIKEKNKQKIIFFYKGKFGYLTSSYNFDEIIPFDNNLIIKLDNILKETKEGTIEKIKENEEIKALSVNYDDSYDIFYFGRRDRLYRCETVLQFNN